jgi:sugar/nucleoside kinase (ribokinase family)
VRVPLTLPPRHRGPFDAVGLGLNSIDLVTVVSSFPEPNSKQRLRQFARLPGGQAATAMVTCARLGCRARYVGRFGDDELGRMGREALIQEGVDVEAAVTVRGTPNQFAVILVDEGTGDRTIMWDRDPRLSMERDVLPVAAIESGRVLLVDCHETAAATRAASIARAAGIPTVIDVEKVRPGIEALLARIDVIIAAREFPEKLTGRTMAGAALECLAKEFHAPVVCVTLGEEGSLALVSGREIRTPGFSVPVVDTTGAGDVFRGGFIAGWLLGGDDAAIDEVLRYANATAALKCRGLGARTAIPNRAEVDRLLAEGVWRP